MAGLIGARSKSPSKSNSAAFCVRRGQGTVNAQDPTFTRVLGQVCSEPLWPKPS